MNHKLSASQCLSRYPYDDILTWQRRNSKIHSSHYAAAKKTLVLF
ncbi:hypothetical protein ACTXMI_11295 [Psychrobacter celer]